MKRYLPTIFMGALAMLATVIPLFGGPYLGLVLLLALPLWIVFFAMLVRALRP
jgi:hypothetical protein